MQYEADELMCVLCKRRFEAEGDLIPRLLPECGHTFCTQCLNTILVEFDTPTFLCPEDEVECQSKSKAELFPKNFALIKLAQKTNQPKKQELKQNSDFCALHQRKLEITCIQDRVRICSNCALFGAHKNHDIRMEHEVVGEITSRTELLITMYQIVESLKENRIDQRMVEKLAKEFQQKQVSLEQTLKDRFIELHQQLNEQEQRTQAILKINFQNIDQGIARLRKVPHHLFEDMDQWRQEAKDRLDLFEKNIEVLNFINYDMLEVKDSLTPDIILTGEQIVNELEELKDISFIKVQKQTTQLGLKFEANILKNIAKVVECNKVDNVVIEEEEIKTIIKEFAEQSPFKVAKSESLKPYSRESLQRLQGDDENDLLAEVLLNHEELDDDLKEEIETYIQSVSTQDQQKIDMSDSPLGSRGVKYVASLVQKKCKFVKEILLNNCEIEDDGASKLFESLQKMEKLKMLNLDHNKLTTTCMPALQQFIAHNKTVVVSLKGLKGVAATDRILI